MIEHIPIRNIYYMLAYSHDVLSFNEFQEIGKEKFENILDLYTTILTLGVPVLIRGGLQKEYIGYSYNSNVVRGKVNLTDTIKTNAYVKKKLMIDFDEFSEDNLMNQIIKRTLMNLISNSEVSYSQKKKIIAILHYFDNVSTVNLSLSLWDSIIFNKQNSRYRFILVICKYILEKVLIDESELITEFKKMEDEKKLHMLFEKFVYEFYKKESTYLVTHSQINWKTDDGYTEALPVMQPDIVLHHGLNSLIIDTKLYSENMSKRFESSESKQISSNIYQMFSYLISYELKPGESVGGVILYAKTKEDEQPDHKYRIKGKNLSITTVDLNLDFKNICYQLLSLANDNIKRIKKTL